MNPENIVEGNRVIDGRKLLQFVNYQHNQLLKADAIVKQLRKDKDELESLPSAASVTENFKNIFEAELQCSICTEIFINPINLSCMHTVCSHCWTHWKHTHTAVSCPICRDTVTSDSKALVIENFINKFVDGLGTDYKRKRDAIVADRLLAPPPKKPKYEEPEYPSFQYNPPTAPGSLDTDNPIILLRDVGRPSNSRLPLPDRPTPRVPVITIEESVILVE